MPLFKRNPSSLKQRNLLPSRLLILPILALSFFTPLISSIPASAAPTIDTSKAATSKDYLYGRIYAEGVSCLFSNYGDTDGDSDVVRRGITAAEAGNMNIFTGSDGDSGDNSNTGSDIMSLVTSAKDGIINCDELESALKTVIPMIYDDPMDFINKFYDKQSDGNYRLKGSSDAKAAARAILDSQFVKSLDSGDAANIRWAVAFAQCFKESDSSASNTPGLSKNYVYIKDKNSSSTIWMGVTSGIPNNRKTCAEILSYAQSNDLVKFMDQYDISTGTLRNNPQNLYAAVAEGNLTDEAMSTARSDIIDLLEANPNVVTSCLATATLPSTIPITGIAEWLITGDTMYLPAGGAGASTVTATDAQASNLKACLLGDDSAIKDDLTKILEDLDEDLATIGDTTTGLGTTTSDESSEEADACLSSDDFLGWFACPLINMIVKTTERIEDVIKDSLKFDLSTIGTSEDVSNAMKDTWSIFRSLATILLIIGFLIALLAKAIKG